MVGDMDNTGSLNAQVIHQLTSAVRSKIAIQVCTFVEGTASKMRALQHVRYQLHNKVSLTFAFYFLRFRLNSISLLIGNVTWSIVVKASLLL